jgi:hypothetical protein
MDAHTTDLWLAVLTAALVLVTACYAFISYRMLRSIGTILAETKRMADGTGKMAEASQRAYLASLAPSIDSSSEVEQVNPDTITVATTLTNRSPQPITIVAMYVECEGPEVGRRVYEETFNVRVRNHERIVLRTDVPGSHFDVVWFLVEDIAGQRHEIGAAGTKTCTPVARV